MTAHFESWLEKVGSSEFKIMRLQDAPLTETTLDAPETVFRFMNQHLAHSLAYRPDVENFMAVFVDSRQKVIGFEVISNGLLDTLLVHAREVFRSAIIMNAKAVVFVHNHPSGDPSPSESDVKITRDLMRAGQILKIEVLDHVILGRATSERSQGWASLRELGLMSL